MDKHCIQILGVTPISNFPKCPARHPCTEFCEIDKLYIPCHKIVIENILQVFFKVCISSFKVICTPAGKKLVIDGKKQIKVLFVADDRHHCIRSANFEIPFCTFVLLKDIEDEVIRVCTVVEDISVKYLDCKYLAITSIVFICPVFKKDHLLFPEYPIDLQIKTNDITKSESDDNLECNCNTLHDHELHSMCKNCKSKVKL